MEYSSLDAHDNLKHHLGQYIGTLPPLTSANCRLTRYGKIFLQHYDYQSTRVQSSSDSSLHYPYYPCSNIQTSQSVTSQSNSYPSPSVSPTQPELTGKHSTSVPPTTNSMPLGKVVQSTMAYSLSSRVNGYTRPTRQFERGRIFANPMREGGLLLRIWDAGRALLRGF